MKSMTVRTMPIVVVPADAEVDVARVHRLLRESIAALDPVGVMAKGRSGVDHKSVADLHDPRSSLSIHTNGGTVSDPFERVLDEAAAQEAAVMGEAKATIRAAVDDGLARLRPSLAQLHRDSLARFWNELAGELERITDQIKADRVTFEPLWSDLATELEHLAHLKERIVSIRSQIGDEHHVH